MTESFHKTKIWLDEGNYKGEHEYKELYDFISKNLRKYPDLSNYLSQQGFNDIESVEYLDVEMINNIFTYLDENDNEEFRTHLNNILKKNNVIGGNRKSKKSRRSKKVRKSKKSRKTKKVRKSRR
jgi:hypothetical protein